MTEAASNGTKRTELFGSLIASAILLIVFVLFTIVITFVGTITGYPPLNWLSKSVSVIGAGLIFGIGVFITRPTFRTWVYRMFFRFVPSPIRIHPSEPPLGPGWILRPDIVAGSSFFFLTTLGTLLAWTGGSVLGVFICGGMTAVQIFMYLSYRILSLSL
jgi:hypothetical protein